MSTREEIIQLLVEDVANALHDRSLERWKEQGEPDEPLTMARLTSPSAMLDGARAAVKAILDSKYIALITLPADR